MGGEPMDPKLFEKQVFESSGVVHGETDHVKSTDARQSVDVPQGQWVDVRRGQVAAEGTVTNDRWPGVLFDAADPSKVVCWHLVKSVFACNRRNIRPEQVVIDPETGAGWCPTCFSVKRKLERKSRPRTRRARLHYIKALKVQQNSQIPGILVKDSSESESEVVWREQDAET